MTRPIAPSAGRGRPRWEHLQPVLDAEAGWGNSTDGFQEGPDGWSTAILRRPLHVDRLKAVFDFPPGIDVARSDNGDTALVDSVNLLWMAHVNPRRRLGPPRPARTGLLARILGP